MLGTTQPTSVPPRRHPYQVYLAALMVVSGIPSMLGGPRPGSIEEYLPLVMGYVWAGVLAVSGVLVVAAAVVRSELTALYLERVAHGPLAVMALTYSGTVFAFAGLRGSYATGIAAGVAIAAAFRARQVARDIRVVREKLQQEG